MCRQMPSVLCRCYSPSGRCIGAHSGMRADVLLPRLQEKQLAEAALYRDAMQRVYAELHDNRQAVVAVAQLYLAHMHLAIFERGGFTKRKCLEAP